MDYYWHTLPDYQENHQAYKLKYMVLDNRYTIKPIPSLFSQKMKLMQGKSEDVLTNQILALTQRWLLQND